MSKVLIVVLVLLATAIGIHYKDPTFFATLKNKFFTEKKQSVTFAPPVTTLSAEDKKAIVTQLNKAFADEWLAYYQYWMGAKVVQGPLVEKVATELMEHAEEELEHAGMLSTRITQLDGKPLLNPKEWFTQTTCGFMEPSDPSVTIILQQNIKGEECAVKAYKELINLFQAKDPGTGDMLKAILAVEEKHIRDLTELLNQIK